MEEYERQLRLAEYSTLRSELLQGKQFVFERPLLIVVAAGVAAAQLAGNDLLLALPASLAAVLLLNIAFTLNRLNSMARIIAYIEAVLEPDSEIRWIGWERSLRKYRIWINERSRQNFWVARTEEMKDAAIPDGMMFFPHILAIHGMAFTAALGGSLFLTFESSQHLWVRLAALGATVGFGVALGTFAWFQLCGPRKIKAAIEEQRAGWTVVFKETGPSNSEQEP